MKIKVKCEFEMDFTLLDNEGDIETDTEKYKDYISFLLRKSYSKSIADFFEDRKREEKSKLFQHLSKQLANQVDETKQIVDSLKLNVKLEVK